MKRMKWTRVEFTIQPNIKTFIKSFTTRNVGLFLIIADNIGLDNLAQDSVSRPLYDSKSKFDNILLYWQRKAASLLGTYRIT